MKTRIRSATLVAIVALSAKDILNRRRRIRHTLYRITNRRLMRIHEKPSSVNALPFWS